MVDLGSILGIRLQHRIRKDDVEELEDGVNHIAKFNTVMQESPNSDPQVNSGPRAPIHIK